MKLRVLAFTMACCTLAYGLAGAAGQPPAPSAAVLARGRALVTFGACNDCHTPGWRESDGAVPLKNWMIGNPIGYRGWWGTSYAANVRLVFQVTSEDRWIEAVRTRAGRPPMIWPDLRGVPDSDLRAIYQFIRSLGPAGKEMPAAVEPWREPKTRFIDMRAIPGPSAEPARK